MMKFAAVLAFALCVHLVVGDQVNQEVLKEVNSASGAASTSLAITDAAMELAVSINVTAISASLVTNGDVLLGVTFATISGSGDDTLACQFVISGSSSSLDVAPARFHDCTLRNNSRKRFQKLLQLVDVYMAEDSATSVVISACAVVVAAAALVF